MPDFPIVDAHVHLYDPGMFRYSWVKGNPVLDRRSLLPEFDRARAQVEIETVVFVEVGADPGQNLQEASYIALLAEREPRLGAMVAAAPLERGAAVTPDLEKLAAHALTRSIRRLIEIETEAGFCLRPGFVEGVKLLPRFELAFDLCVRHWQLADAVELVRRCPEVRIVLDHIGKPPIRDGVMAPWTSHIKELSEFPNVWCKLSGVVTEADHRHWTRDAAPPLHRPRDRVLRLRSRDVRLRLAGLRAEPPLPRVGRGARLGHRRLLGRRAQKAVPRQRERVLPDRARAPVEPGQPCR